MLNITYAPNDAATAEKLQQDLSAADLRLLHHFMIVLVTPDSMGDSGVETAIERAHAEGHRVLSVVLQRTDMLQTLAGHPVVDLSGGYQAKPVIRALRDADVDRRRPINRLVLLAAVILVLIMFAVSLYGILSGSVAFPVAEYQTENAERAATIDSMVGPTLDVLVPRTTDEARNFPATVDAVPTYERMFLRGTATQMALDGQATPEAGAE